MTPIKQGTAHQLGLRKPHLRFEVAMDRALIEAARGDSQLRRLLLEGKDDSAAWHRQHKAKADACRAGIEQRAEVLLESYAKAFEVLKGL